MKIVLQRVNKAYIEVGGETVGSIDKGYLIFLGVAEFDDKTAVEKAVDKIFRLRIFADENGKTNLSANDVGGGILVVSQFTLMAELNSNRPSFSRAAGADKARELYEYFLEQCKDKFAKTASGRFGAHMRVYADNDGPFTLFIEG
jgi:D-tyrosyl-tRNA(Tyr) deacylase